MAGKAVKPKTKAPVIQFVDIYPETTDTAAALAALRVLLGLPAETPPFQPVNMRKERKETAKRQTAQAGQKETPDTAKTA